MIQLKFKSIQFKKLNNAEYAYFAGQVVNQIQATGLEVLHIPEATFASYQEGVDKLSDCGKESRIVSETIEIGEKKQEACALVSYILSVSRKAQSIPIAAKSVAGTVLYNALGTYRTLYRLPQRQFVQNLKGMLKDLAKEEIAEHVVTLGLSDEVATLSAIYSKCDILLAKRTATQAANTMEYSKTIREDMDALYEEITNVVFAYSITTPSEDLTNFITYVNRLIDETNTAYNQRKAQANRQDTAKEE